MLAIFVSTDGIGKGSNAVIFIYSVYLVTSMRQQEPKHCAVLIQILSLAYTITQLSLY